MASRQRRPMSTVTAAVLLMGAVTVAIVVLLMLPGTAGAFEDAERERDQRTVRR